MSSSVTESTSPRDDNGAALRLDRVDSPDSALALDHEGAANISGTGGPETTLRLRVIQAISGEPVFEPELEVPASMTVGELCGRIGSEGAPCARRRFKLLARGGLLDDCTRLSDLSLEGPVLELQLLCMPAKRLEPVPPDAVPFRRVGLVLLGDATVGKSSMCLQFGNSDLTLGLHPQTMRTFRLDDRINIKAQVWDKAGNFYRNVLSAYSREACGVLVVFDVTNRDTFEHVQTWLDNVRTWLGERGDEVVIALAGNKVDLPETSRVVSPAEAEALASRVGISYFESSALADHPSAIEGLLLEVCAQLT